MAAGALLEKPIAWPTRPLRPRGSPPLAALRTNAVPTPHTLLGVDADACEADVKRAFRRLALRYHPDVSDEPDARESFERLQAAYRSLLQRRRGEAEEASSEPGGDWRARLAGLAARREHVQAQRELGQRVRAAVRQSARRGSAAAFYSGVGDVSAQLQGLREVAAKRLERRGGGGGDDNASAGYLAPPLLAPPEPSARDHDAAADAARRQARLADDDMERFLRLARLARQWRAKVEEENWPVAATD